MKPRPAEAGTPTGNILLSLDDVRRILWLETWWKWDRPANDPLMLHDFVCHYFNLCEAAIWFVLSILVLRRWRLNHCRSGLEIGYSVAFLLFGVSDIIEAWMLTSWLLWWKAANLILLLLIRRTVMRRFYPASRLF